MRRAEGTRIRTNMPGDSSCLGIVEKPRNCKVPVDGSSWLSTKLIVPSCGNRSSSSASPRYTGAFASRADFTLPAS